MPYLDSVASRSRFVITWVSELLNGIIKGLLRPSLFTFVPLGEPVFIGRTRRTLAAESAPLRSMSRRSSTVTGAVESDCLTVRRVPVTITSASVESAASASPQNHAAVQTQRDRRVVEFLRRIGFPESDPIECPRSISLMQGTRRRPRTQSDKPGLSHAAARYACSSYGRQRPTQCNT